MGVPTAASLLNGSAAAAPSVNNNNILLQALMNQQAPPAPAPAPAPTPPPANNSQLNQLAQLLQGRGIDANALAGLLGKSDTPSAQPPTPEKASSGYSTAYPSVSSYDYGYKSTNYGPSKDDKRGGYRPY